MEVALHLGAHYTDGGHVEKCLLANRSLLSEQGISVLGQPFGIKAISRALEEHASGDIPLGLFEQILKQSGLDDLPGRVALSAPDLLSPASNLVGPRAIYPFAIKHLQTLTDLLAEHSVEIFLGLRNPASMIPALVADQPPAEREALMSRIRKETLTWENVITRIRSVWPEASMTVWCDEDTPFIWHQLLTSISGVTPDTKLAGSYDWYDSILTDGIAAKLGAYMASLGDPSVEVQQNVISTFLDKFCDPQKIDVDVSVTGWDDATIAEISERYDADIETISNRADVTFIEP